jgi:hypothetical protein
MRHTMRLTPDSGGLQSRFFARRPVSGQSLNLNRLILGKHRKPCMFLTAGGHRAGISMRAGPFEWTNDVADDFYSRLSQRSVDSGRHRKLRVGFFAIDASFGRALRDVVSNTPAVAT